MENVVCLLPCLSSLPNGELLKGSRLSFINFCLLWVQDGT